MLHLSKEAAPPGHVVGLKLRETRDKPCRARRRKFSRYATVAILISISNSISIGPRKVLRVVGRLWNGANRIADSMEHCRSVW
jgi:hypothetical protein